MHYDPYFQDNTWKKKKKGVFLLEWASLVAQVVKYLPEMQEAQVRSLGLEDPLEKGMATHSSILFVYLFYTPVFLPGKLYGWRSLAGYSPWGHKESDTLSDWHFHFSRSDIGEGNGNPPQCSCLENPRDGGAWWASVYGVTQSRTQLKWLSSSSSSYTWNRRIS